MFSAVDDPMALHENARSLVEQIPDARLFVIKDGGDLMLGHNETVKAEINRFINQAIRLNNQITLLCEGR